MKRIIALILMLATLVCALASCGGGKTDISGATSLADLKGAKIAAQSGTFHEDALTQIEDVKDSVYPDFTQLLVALKSGVIDGYIAEEPTALAVCMDDESLGYVKLENNKTGFTATDADVAIAIGCKTGSSLVNQINEVLNKISESDKKALMEQMVSLNAGESIGELAISNSAPATTTGTLKVAMECAYAPFNWTQTNAENGAVPIEGEKGLYANGYDVQIAKYVANELGLELVICKAVWESLVPGVQSGIYDAIIAGMSPTAEREEEIDFSVPYYTSNLVVVYKKK